MIYAPKRRTVANLQQKEQEEEHTIFSRLSTRKISKHRKDVGK